MSFLGALGYIMSQNRLRNHLETVYANNSVSHMLTGHAYIRAIRICFQQLLLWLTCLIHPTVDMNQQDKIPTWNAIKNICMIDVLHKEDDVTQVSQAVLGRVIQILVWVE